MTQFLMLKFTCRYPQTYGTDINGMIEHNWRSTNHHFMGVMEDVKHYTSKHSVYRNVEKKDK